MFSRINEAAETATSRFKRRMYDPQMNVPVMAELYLLTNLTRWPIDFAKEYITDKRHELQDRAHHP
ncbi:MAG: hypothetical protein J4400_02135 [Candidatus Aenigmarchaeota archaeon]|nr:hypothetical protein [Candidatus Aenigmarchaeota archaeon]